MRKVTQKDFIQKQMDLMFADVNHQNSLEQEGIALGLGYTAAAHFDAVLTKLEERTKADGGKKSSGIIGFIKVVFYRDAAMLIALLL